MDELFVANIFDKMLPPSNSLPTLPDDVEWICRLQTGALKGIWGGREERGSNSKNMYIYVIFVVLLF